MADIGIVACGRAHQASTRRAGVCRVQQQHRSPRPGSEPDPLLQPGSWEYDINNRLQSWGVASQRTEITYDPNGHAVREARAGQVTDYVYSAHERLVEVRRNGQAVGRYQHDPFGRRIRKETAGQVTWFVYDEEGLVAELDAAGNARRIYGWVPDTMWGTAPVFQADAASNGWQTYVLHTDHLGTPQRATDSQGTVAWAMRSEAFGASTPLPESTIDVALRFPGQYYDTETGLHYNWQRDHSPLIGRYVQQDPIGLAGGINLYGYAEGNPITLFDPTGEAVPALIIKAGAMYVRCFVSCMGFETLSDYLFNDCFDLLGSAKENAGDCAVHCLNPFNWGGRGNMRNAKPKEYGSYTNTHRSGKRYHGQGDRDRARRSGREKEMEHNDPLVSTDWKSANSRREAFIDEARRIRADGGKNNPQNYNKINSPGERYGRQGGLW